MNHTVTEMGLDQVVQRTLQPVAVKPFPPTSCLSDKYYCEEMFADDQSTATASDLISYEVKFNIGQFTWYLMKKESLFIKEHKIPT